MKKIVLLIAAAFSLVSFSAIAVPKAAESENGTVTSAPATTPLPKKEKKSAKKSSKSKKSTKKSTGKKSTKKSAKKAK